MASSRSTAQAVQYSEEALDAIVATALSKTLQRISTNPKRRLRMVYMVLPDIIAQMHQMQEQERVTNSGLQAVHEFMNPFSQPGVQVTILEITSQPSCPCDVTIFRGFLGEKIQYTDRWPFTLTSEANLLTDKFKSRLELLGYVCWADNWATSLAV